MRAEVAGRADEAPERMKSNVRTPMTEAPKGEI